MKPNYFKTKSLLVALTMIIIGCDDFENDLQLEDESLLQVVTSRQVTPGASILIDLKEANYSESEVTYGIERNAEKGELEFVQNGFLKYTLEKTASGNDLFSISISSGDRVIDIDTIGIEIITDTTMVSCFGGAISDSYQLLPNQSLTLSPLINDGYCPDEVSSVELFIDKPTIGTLIEVGPDSIIFISPSDFSGSTEFMYTLKLVDLEDEVYESSAFITIEAIETVCFEAVDDFYQFSYGDVDSVAVTEWYFNPLENDLLCNQGYILEIMSLPEKGELTLLDDNTMKYEYDQRDSLAVTSEYKLCFGDECDTADITILLD